MRRTHPVPSRYIVTIGAHLGSCFATIENEESTKTVRSTFSFASPPRNPSCPRVVMTGWFSSASQLTADRPISPGLAGLVGHVLVLRVGQCAARVLGARPP